VILGADKRGYCFFQWNPPADGRDFVSGADFNNDLGWINTAEIFDPVSETFSIVSPGPAVRRDRHASVTLLDGRVLLLGGFASRASATFNTGTGTFASLPDLPAVHGFGLTATRLSDGRVVVAGGAGEGTGDPTDVPLLGTFTDAPDRPDIVSGGAEILLSRWCTEL